MKKMNIIMMNKMCIRDRRMKMPPKKASFFKKETSNPLTDYIDELNKSCFICDRINNTFERYLHTVVATWKSDAAFRELYAKGKGFCTEHYGDLLKEGAKYLNQKELDELSLIHICIKGNRLSDCKGCSKDCTWLHS